MKKNSLDLSGKIDPATIELYGVINRVVNKLNVSYVVIGATARDIVLVHGYGARIRRATTDVDFGMQVESWDVFKQLKNELIGNGFKSTKSVHRLINSKHAQIDIVPFGAVKDKKWNIQWPPDGAIEMNVLGFQEAHDHAIKVIIQQDPLIEIPVATSQGLALLKLIAWSARERNIRKKDAKDLAYLLETYERVEDVGNRIYEENKLMEQYDWQAEFASAHILGADSAAIAHASTKQQILNILKQNLNANDPNALVEDMCERIEEEYDEKLNLLWAFANGFR